MSATAPRIAASGAQVSTASVPASRGPFHPERPLSVALIPSVFHDKEPPEMCRLLAYAAPRETTVEQVIGTALTDEFQLDQLSARAHVLGRHTIELNEQRVQFVR